MEQENRIKLSLSTVLLIITIIIIILLVAIFLIQKTSGDKKLADANDKIASLEKNNKSQEKTINNLQNKIEVMESANSTNNLKIPELSTGNTLSNSIENNISNTITNSVQNTMSNSITNTTTNTLSNNITTNLTQQEAISIGKECYQKALNSYWNIATNQENKIQFNGNEYLKINNINDIKSIYSTNGFQKYTSSTEIIQKDGVYYKSNADRGSNIYYMNNSLTLTNKTSAKIEFISQEKYYINDEDRESNNTNTTQYITQDNKFTIVKENGVWKVEEFTLPN